MLGVHSHADESTTDTCASFDLGGALALPLVPVAAYGVSLALA